MAVGFSGKNEQRAPALCYGLYLLGCLAVLAAGCSKVARTQDVADAPERRALLENIAQ